MSIGTISVLSLYLRSQKMAIASDKNHFMAQFREKMVAEMVEIAGK
jgi:hypothetical protein